MKLSKRNTTCAIIYFWVMIMLTNTYIIMTTEKADGYVSTHEYSAKEIVLPFSWFKKDSTEEQEISNILSDDVELMTTNDITSIADDIKELSTDALANNSNYEVPINEVPHLKSGEILEGEYITIDLDKVMLYVDAEYDDYDWDTKKRIRDIYILKEILVNQLGVSPTKAAAIIGNVCCEDSFAGLTNSVANLNDLEHAKSVLGNGNRGYGCVQWTASYRQKGLQDYYEVVNKDLDWELTSVVAETAYIYNELCVSEILGDLSEDDDLMHVTGIVGCVYEAYAKSSSEWYKQDGRYKTNGCQRYTYAKNIYDLICKEVK